MGFIGKIIQHFINDTVREVVTELQTNYNKTSILILPPGIDACPILGDQATLTGFDKQVGLYIDEAGHSAIIGVIPPGLVNEGEIKLIGRVITDGSQASYILCKPDGNIELNGNTDFAVRYLELETAFNQLKLDHDNFLAEYKLHVHGGVTSGSASTGATISTQMASTADITPVKVDTVLLPGK